MPVPKYAGNRKTPAIRRQTKARYQGGQGSVPPPQGSTVVRQNMPNVYGGYIDPKRGTYDVPENVGTGMPNVYGGYMDPQHSQHFWGTSDWRTRLAQAGQPRRWSYTGTDRNLWGMAPELYKSSVDAARARYYNLPTAYNPSLYHPYLTDPATGMLMPTWESLFPNVPSAGTTLMPQKPGLTAVNGANNFNTFDKPVAGPRDKSKVSLRGPVGELTLPLDKEKQAASTSVYGGYGGYDYPYYGGGGGGYEYKNNPSYRARPTSSVSPGPSPLMPQPTIRATSADLRRPAEINRNMARWMQLLTTWRV